MADVGAGAGVTAGAPEASKLISLRVPMPMLDELRRHAARRAMPYQSLLKHWLAERLEEEGLRLERHRAALPEPGGSPDARPPAAERRSSGDP